MVANFNKKQKGEFFTEELLFKTIGTIFLIAIIVFIFADIKMYQKKQLLKSQVNLYQKQIDDLMKSNQNLKNEIANADNKDYLEKVAYEQLGQQKPGEKQIIFVLPENKKTTDSAKASGAEAWLGWFSGAWQWIKNKF